MYSGRIILLSVIIWVLFSISTVNAATPVNSCITINQPGVYVLNTDIINSPSTACINITVENVVLDGRDHVIDGMDLGNTYGVYVYNSSLTLTNVTIRNLTVSDWTFGINYVGVTASILEDITARSNTDGIRLESVNSTLIANSTATDMVSGTGIWMKSGWGNNITGNNVSNNKYGIYLESGSNNIIANNTVQGNSQYGIWFYSNSDGNTVANNSLHGNTQGGIRIEASSDNNLVRNNTVNQHYSGTGIWLKSGWGNRITGNNASNNNLGIYLESASNNTVVNNTVQNNSQHGIWFYSNSDGNTVANNTLHGNAQDGIRIEYLSDNNLVANNTVRQHISGTGIWLKSGWDNRITGNNASNNKYGIYLESGRNNIIANNTVQNNSQHGIWVYSNSNGNTVANNTVSQHISGTGIWFETGWDNNITGNNVSNNKYGIHLYWSGSNTVSNNTVQNNSQYGIYLRTNSDGNTVANNTVRGNSLDGIRIEASSDTNLVTNNTVSQHTSGTGIWLKSGSGNRITGNNASNNKYGIYLESTSSCTVSNNTVQDNSQHGIWLYSSSNGNTVANNTVRGNAQSGIYILTSGGSTLSGNIMAGNTYNLHIGGSSVSDYILTMDTTNTVDGKPVYYLVGASDMIIDASTNPGFVGVVSSENITVRDLSLSNNGHGVLFVNTTNSSIENVTATGNNDGIYISTSGGSTLSGNIMAGNTYNLLIGGSSVSDYILTMDTTNTVDGKPVYYLVGASDMTIDASSSAGFVGVVSSENITVRDLSLSNNSHGVLFVNTTNSSIENVTATGNNDGIYLFSSSNSTVTGSNASNNAASGFVLWSGSTNNTIANSTTLNNRDGVYLNSADENTIYNVTATGNTRYGVYLVGSDSNTLTSITAANNSQAGIYLYSYSDGNIVANNTVQGNRFGIYLHSNSDGNTVAGNTVQGSTWYGIWLSSESRSNTVANNTVEGNSQHGIVLYYYSGGNTVTSNTVQNNSQDGIHIYFNNYGSTVANNTVRGNSGHGIYLDNNYDNSTVANNTVRGNSGHGIYLRYNSDGNTVVNNTVQGNSLDGIRIEGSSGNNLVANNTVGQHTSGMGIWLKSGSGNNITDNNVSSNKYGVYLGSGSASTLLRDNRVVNSSMYGLWLSSAGGVTAYNNLFNNTNNTFFSGTLYNNTWNTSKQSGTSIAGGLYLGGNYWAYPNGTGFSETCADTDYDSICDTAYNLSSGNVDYLPLVKPTTLGSSVTSCGVIDSPGVYTLQNSITDSSASICIDIWSDDVVFDGAGYTLDGTDAPGSRGVYVRLPSSGGISNITVKNLIVTDWHYGITYSNASDGRIQNNSLTSNIDAIRLDHSSANNTVAGNTASGNGGGTGIRIDSLSSNVTVVNNTASGNSFGIFVGGGSDSVTMRNNTATGNGVYGIWVNASSSATLVNNTASSNTQNGIYLSWSTDAVAENNTATGMSSGSGVYVLGGSGSNLTGNTLTGNKYGVYLDSTVNATLRGNNVSSNVQNGIYLSWSNDTIAENNTATGMGNGTGIYVLGGSGSNLTGNTLTGNKYGIWVNATSGATLVNNTASSNAQNGIYISWSTDAVAENNTATGMGNGTGIYVLGGSGSNLAGNTLTGNKYGVYLDSTVNATLWGNNVSYGSSYQIPAVYLLNTNTSSVLNTTAYGSGNKYGILLNASHGNTIANNTVEQFIYLFTLVSSNNNTLADNSGSGVNTAFTLYSPSSGNVIARNDFTSLQTAFDSVGSSNYNSVVNNTFQVSNVGIELEGSYSNVSGNRVTGSGIYGIYIGGSYNRVHNNTLLTGSWFGIGLSGSNNNLTWNNVSGTSGNGIDLSGASNNRLSNNTAAGNAGHGVFLGSSSSGNVIINNTVRGNSQDGIRIDTGNSNLVANNTISQHSSGTGIWQKSTSGSNVSGNSITGNKYGIYLESASSALVENNTITSATAYGIWLNGGNGHTLSNNTLRANAQDFYSSSSSSGNTLTDNLFNSTIASFTYSGDIKVNTSSSPAPDPSGYYNISKYLNITNASAAWVYLNISYAGDDLTMVVESSLGMWEHNGTGWSRVSGTSGVNMAENYVYANLTSFSVFAPMGISSIITNCTTIFYPGSYRLGADITNSTARACINITVNNVTIDGAGNILNGTGLGEYGIYAHNSTTALTGIKVRNLTLTGWTAGVYYNNTHSGSLENLTLSSNTHGISLVQSRNTTLTSNSIAGSTYNLFIQGSSVSNYIQHIDTSNTVDGKPVYYLLNASDVVIDASSGAGFVGAVHSNNITVRDLSLRNNSHGVLFVNTTDSTIQNVTTTGDNYGIYLFFSANNTIRNNTLYNNTVDGIRLNNASGNLIAGNTITLHTGGSGIFLNHSISNNITDSILTGNKYGIYLNYSNISFIENNTLSDGSFYDIYIYKDSVNNTITGNTITGNNNSISIVLRSCRTNNVTHNRITGGLAGIYLWDVYQDILVINNTITNSLYYGVYLRSSTWNILRNNTVTNSSEASIYLEQASYNGIYNNLFNSTNNTGFWGTTYTNFWNISKQAGTSIAGGPYLGGNYWAKPDGTGFSETCTDADSDGICDSLYTLSTNNTDYLPLTTFTPLGSSVSSCGVITSPGVYTLQNSIINSTVSTCITISSSNVTFDGMGHTIDGVDAGNSIGVYAQGSAGSPLTNITVKNLTVTDWAYGITYLYVRNSSLTSINASKNIEGLFLNYSSRNTIASSTATSNSDIGIWLMASKNNTLTGNNASSSNSGIFLFDSSDGNTLTENAISDTKWGIYLSSSDSNTLVNNNATHNSQHGIFIETSTGNIIQDNIASLNGLYGIYLYSNSDGNTVANNTVQGNSQHGIHLYSNSDGNTVANNTVQNNSQNGIYLDSSTGNTIDGNTVSSNKWGIVLLNSNSNTLNSNTVSSNSLDGIRLDTSSSNSIVNNTVSQHSSGTGIWQKSTSGSNVSGNSITGNKYGIYLESASSALVENNTITSATAYGIWLNGGNGHTLRNNTLRANAQDFYSSSSSSGNTLTDNLFNSTIASFTYSGDIKVNTSSAPAIDPTGYHNISKYLKITNSTPAWVYLNISYDDADVAGLDEGTFRIWKYNGSGWGQVPGTNGVSTGQNYVYANLTSFSVFAPMGQVDATSPDITFVAPTPANGSEVTVNYVFVNITVSEDLNTALLEWNGTNYTMSGSGTNWYMNRTGLANGEYEYKVWGNDSAGNMNLSETRIVTVNVTQPDTTPPAINVISPQNTTYATKSITLNVSTSEVANVTYSLNGGANISLYNVSTSGSTTITASEGANYVVFYAVDSSGNENSTGVDFSVDTTAPAITISSPQNATYRNATVDLNVSADEVVDTWWYSLNGGANVTFTPNTTIIAAEGANRLVVYANDSTGNLGVVEVRFTVDTTLPSIMFVSPTPANGSTVSVNYVYVNVTASEPVSAALLEWDVTNHSMLCSGTNCYLNMTGLANGNYTYKVWANDSAGNLNVSEQRVVTVSVVVSDTTPPSIAFVSPTPANGSTVTVDYVYVNTTASEDINTALLDFAGVNHTMACSGSNCYLNMTGLANGNYSYRVYVNDSAGNMNSTELRVVTVNVPPRDTTPPAITVYSPENTTYTTKSITLNVSTSEVANVTYSLNGGANISLYNVSTSGSTTITASEGANYVVFYAVDSSGNENSTGVDFSVDTTAPAITISSPQNTTYANKTIDLNVSANEQVDTWWYSLNGGANTTFTPNTTITASEGGNYLVAYANDSVGNLGSAEVYFTVDTTAPSIAFVAPTHVNGSVVTVNYVYVNITAIEGLNTALLEWNGTNYTMSGSGSNWYLNKTGLANGDYYYRVYANDSAGNMNMSESRVVTVNVVVPDTTPPVITFVAPTPVNDSAVTVDYVFVNVTSSEDINTALLEWSGVNSTMLCSGTNCYLNKTGLANGDYVYKVWANDSAGNLNVSETRVVTVNIPPAPPDTTPPVISGLKVSRHPLVNSTTSNNTVISWSASDAGGIHQQWVVVKHGNGTLYNLSYTASPFILWVTQYGTYNVSVYANDTAGNLASSSVPLYVEYHISTKNTTVNASQTLAIVNDSEIKVTATAGVNGGTLALDVKMLDTNGTFGIASIASDTSTAASITGGIRYLKITNTTPIENITRFRIELPYTASEKSGKALYLMYWNGSIWYRLADYAGKTIPDASGGLYVYSAGDTGSAVYAEVNHTSTFGIGISAATSSTASAASGGEYIPEVTLLANSIDFALAQELVAYLKARGITVYTVDAANFSDYSRKQYVIILGGPRAYEGVGEIVAGILNEEDNVKIFGGSTYIKKRSTFHSSGVVYVFAGKDRNATREAWEEQYKEVAREIEYNWG